MREKSDGQVIFQRSRAPIAPIFHYRSNSDTIGERMASAFYHMPAPARNFDAHYRSPDRHGRENGVGSLGGPPSQLAFRGLTNRPRWRSDGFPIEIRGTVELVAMIPSAVGLGQLDLDAWRTDHVLRPVWAGPGFAAEDRAERASQLAHASAAARYDYPAGAAVIRVY